MDGLLDKWILLYVVFAAGLTELIMRGTSDGVTRRKYAWAITTGLAVLAALLTGSTLKYSWSDSIFRGGLAAALSTWAYGAIKSAVLGWRGGDN
jgi:hypothetical protein